MALGTENSCRFVGGGNSGVKFLHGLFEKLRGCGASLPGPFKAGMLISGSIRREGYTHNVIRFVGPVLPGRRIVLLLEITVHAAGVGTGARCSRGVMPHRLQFRHRGEASTSKIVCVRKSKCSRLRWNHVAVSDDSQFVHGYRYPRAVIASPLPERQFGWTLICRSRSIAGRPADLTCRTIRRFRLTTPM